MKFSVSVETPIPLIKVLDKTRLEAGLNGMSRFSPSPSTSEQSLEALNQSAILYIIVIQCKPIYYTVLHFTTLCYIALYSTVLC